MPNPALRWRTLSFDALTTVQLYSLLRLRSEVFVVEQNCVYQDLDDYDQAASHTMAEDAATGQVLCVARILAPGLKYPEASIGRVVTSPLLRRTGQGRELVAQAVEACTLRYPRYGITISAQQHLEDFYAAFDFVTMSEPYLEDNIPHIRMTRMPAHEAGSRD